MLFATTQPEALAASAGPLSRIGSAMKAARRPPQLPPAEWIAGPDR
jgi:hypothetical protein